MQGSFSIRLARTGEFLLGALFLCAAVLKLANVPLFASQILSYEVITNPKLVALAAEILVPLEAALGLAMLAGIRAAVPSRGQMAHGRTPDRARGLFRAR